MALGQPEPLVFSASEAETAFISISRLPQLSPPGSNCVDKKQARVEQSSNAVLKQSEMLVHSESSDVDMATDGVSLLLLLLLLSIPLFPSLVRLLALPAALPSLSPPLSLP